MRNHWIEHTNTDVWEYVEYEKSEPTYYYKWEKLYNNELIETTNFVTDMYAENNNLKANGWRKIERSKRTFDDQNENSLF